MSAWAPTDKQIEALERTEYEILFGGSRGGGKTDAGMAFLKYHEAHPKYKALVIRRNADDLRDWIDRVAFFFPHAKITGKPAEIRLPAGGVIRTGHLKDESAYTKYQGHEYQTIVIEELSQIANERNYETLIASCRSSVPEIPAQIFCTANPDGIGAAWVKRRFVLPSEYGKPFLAKTGRTRVYIHSTIDDNPHLVSADPDYVKFLESLPKGLMEQWRYGSWDDYDIDGAVYAHILKETKHKCQLSYEINPDADTYTAWDLGYDDDTAIWFYQIIGNEVHIIDYHEARLQEVEHYVSVLKKKKYNYVKHFAPHDVANHNAAGVTMQEVAARKGLQLTRVERTQNLEADIEQVRQMLPKCIFLASNENVRVGLEHLRMYRRSYDTKLDRYTRLLHDNHSHSADAFRTLIMSLPFNLKRHLNTIPQKHRPREGSDYAV